MHIVLQINSIEVEVEVMTWENTKNRLGTEQPRNYGFDMN